MIVDDERLVRWSLRQKCEEWGYQVVEADTGEIGLRLAQRESPDLVLLDVRLPDISGIDVLDQLKRSGDARAIIMSSSMWVPMRRNQAAKACTKALSSMTSSSPAPR